VPLVYKILPRAALKQASAAGSYAGSEDDRRDGYIHLSAGAQLDGTARRHFRDRGDLVLVAYDPAELGAVLKWEPSRFGDLFPHLYGELPTAVALWVLPLTLAPDGVPIIPGDVETC